MMRHSAFSIVFQLQYVFSCPLAGDGQVRTDFQNFLKISIPLGFMSQPHLFLDYFSYDKHYLGGPDYLVILKA